MRKCILTFPWKSRFPNLPFYYIIPVDITGCLWPNNTVIFYNILTSSKESSKKFYAALIMKTVVDNFIMYFFVICVVLLVLIPWGHPEDGHSSDRNM
jgi:hypothetical protein